MVSSKAVRWPELIFVRIHNGRVKVVCYNVRVIIEAFLLNKNGPVGCETVPIWLCFTA